MLEDEDFTSKRRVDRYGRKLSNKKGKKELERLYDFDDGDKKESSDEDENIAKELERVDRKDDPSATTKYIGFDESSSSEEGDESSSEEEESDEEDAAVEAGLEGFSGDPKEDYEVGEPSRRLAIQDLDWDHIRAVDLMAVAQSFCPTEGKIEKVAVYPSEFGKERMEREELEGPARELFAKANTNRNEENTRLYASRPSKPTWDQSDSDSASASSSSSSSEAESDDEEEQDPPADDATLQASLLAHAKAPSPEIDTKALRHYQLTRLKYYYAILTTSSTPTASAIYASMDDTEYLSTANYFRLSYVPDEMTFEDPARDECMAVPAGYRPAEFVTEALTHSKVRLTWEEEDGRRKEVQKRAFQKGKGGEKGGKGGEVDENDLAAYVGSDSSSEEERGVDKGGVQLPGQTMETMKRQEGDGTEGGKLSKRNRQRLALGLPIEDDATTTTTITNGTTKSSINKTTKSNSRSMADDQPDPSSMQITFSSALSGPSASTTSKSGKSNNGINVFENNPDEVNESTKDRYIRKEKERKMRRREKARAGRNGEEAPAPTDDDGAFTKVTNDADETGSGKEGVGNEKEDDPFNDPFFTDPSATNASAKSAAKKARREAKAAEAVKGEERKAKDRAGLELLMAEDGGAGGSGTAQGMGRDFDIAEVRRIEKEQRKKDGKRKRSSKGDKGGREGEDGAEAAQGGAKEGGDFKVDVQDPRFAGVFENFEYAIDPSNPRFSGTEGMKRLLEEGRKRRRGEGGDGEGDFVTAGAGSKKKKRKGR